LLERDTRPKGEKQLADSHNLHTTTLMFYSTNRLSLLLAGLFFASFGHAQFEGVVESRNLTSDMSGAAQRFTMKLWVKKGIVKIEMSAIGSTPASTILYRLDVGRVVMLNDQEKTFFEIPQGEAGQGDVERAAPPTVRRTGKTRKILGYSCDQLYIRNGEAETEYWGTKSLSALAAALSKATGSQAGTGVSDDLTAMGYFPLVAVTKMGGKVLESSEVTRLEAMTLPQELFEIPPGYKQQGIRDILQDRKLKK
jgi:hypothetical protein